MNLLKTPRTVSINKREEIEQIINKGVRVSTSLGPIFLYQDKPGTINKVAILVKKNIGSAVKRNYIKRIIREIIRENHHIFKRFNRMVIIFNKRCEVNYHRVRRIYKSAISLQ